MRIHVDGGTNAGSKKPLVSRRKPWWCKCRDNPGYLVNCTECGMRRPD